VLAADGLLSNGSQLAQLSVESMDEPQQVAAAHWSHNNRSTLGDAYQNATRGGDVVHD
jgi:hypothetical protein